MIDAMRVMGDKMFADMVEYEYSRWKNLGRSPEMGEIADRMVRCMAHANGIYRTGTVTDVKPTRRPFGVKFTEDGARWHLHLNSHRTKLERIG